MTSVFKKHIAAMSAYAPPLEGRDPAQHLLLDFNERTLPVSKIIEDALCDYIRSGRLQMYPSYGDVVESIARYCAVPSEQVMITNGSDQGIDLIIRAAASAGDEAIIPEPGFAMYSQVANVENLKIRRPKLSPEFGLNVDEVLAMLGPKTRVICIANPNNPSGTLVPSKDIITIAKAAPDTAILVDECYFEYAKTTVVDRVAEFPNIVVTRTFSKTWGIPSLRMGYVIASKQNIDALTNVRGPYDINQLAVVAVQAALQKPELMQEYVDEVMEQSKPLLESWLAKRKVNFWPSAANFLWAFPEAPETWSEALLAENILVRPKMDVSGALGLRITLGTVSQTQRLIDVIEALSEQSA